MKIKVDIPSKEFKYLESLAEQLDLSIDKVIMKCIRTTNLWLEQTHQCEYCSREFGNEELIRLIPQHDVCVTRWICPGSNKKPYNISKKHKD